MCISNSKTEKSCGTVPFTVEDGKILFLLIQSKENGNCGFPKGHMEGNETEEETALRETFEEASLRPQIIKDKRFEVEYTLKNGNNKTVVYFLADFTDQIPRHNEGFEDLNYLILPFHKAYDMLTFENTKDILKKANRYIERNVIV